MSGLLLILRPEPGAAATAQRAEKAGFASEVASLFVIRPRAWVPPDPAEFDALVLTSANAVRHADRGLADFAALPLYAVGAATADAAREAGLHPIYVGSEDAAALIAQAMADGVRRVLHLAGREHRTLARDGLSVETRVVYAAAAARALPPSAVEAMRAGAVVLLHSPRAAILFRALLEPSGLGPSAVRIAAISAATLKAAGEGWAATGTALAPNDDALLAEAARLCDQGGELRNG